MDLYPDTMAKMIRTYRKQRQLILPTLVKVYVWQLFRSLAFLEGNNICHRDIKPQNILIDQNYYLLKICDYGSAKKLNNGNIHMFY